MDDYSEEDTDDEDPNRTPTQILGTLELQLKDLLYVGSGRPPSDDPSMVRRRVIRNSEDCPGYATKVARFFDAVLLSVTS